MYCTEGGVHTTTYTKPTLWFRLGHINGPLDTFRYIEYALAAGVVRQEKPRTRDGWALIVTLRAWGRFVTCQCAGNAWHLAGYKPAHLA